jgi:peroxiredoxin
MDTNELPAIGAPAPPFSFPASIGEQASLEDYRGKRHVLLAFYVLDFTGG